MKISTFDYRLPPELIAQKPASPRDSSRLLVVDKATETTEHRRFSDLLEYLKAGDCLVMNETRVIPARLIGRKKHSHGQVEVFLLRQVDHAAWEALVKPSRRLKEGAVVEFDGSDVTATIGKTLEDGKRLVGFDYEGSFETVLEKLGRVPLPPYIKQPLDDPERYQTVYAKNSGSVAAPTAGLHFTSRMLEKLRLKGIESVKVTLDVGLGTFRPVQAEDVESHKMEHERFFISEETATAVNMAKHEGRRVIAVGTTSVRVLESAVRDDGQVEPCDSETGLFIYPGYRFKVVDCLLTNFHLPRSSLLLLVCAFAGTELIMDAYKQAIQERYKFYSFGDAMFIW